MVKVNGQRVELEGINYQIKSQLGKRAAVVDMSSSGSDSTISQPFDLIPDLDDEALLGTIIEAAQQCGVEGDRIDDLYPCTALQEGLMALSTRLGKGAYRAQKVFRITDDGFEISRFKTAWRSVAVSEAILRTRIVNTKAAGTLQAVITEDLEWHETEQELDAYLSEDLRSPVTYGGPLLRFALVSNANSRYFVWSAHHAVYDGWSANITFGQVRQALACSGFDFNPVPYKDFIRHLNQSDVAAQSAFWESQFPAGKTPPASYPSVPARYQTQTHDTLKQTLATRVKCAGNLQIMASTILRAAWASVISNYSGHDDVIFAATLSGRTAPVSGISAINGPTITTVPVRIEFDSAGETSIHQFLAAVQAQATDMVPFEHMGLQNIRRQNETARAALDGIANLIVVQPSEFEGDRDLKGMKVVPRNLNDFDSYPLVLLCSISDDGATAVEVKYDRSVISRKQMQRIIRQYDFTLRQLCNKPHGSLGAINAINPDDLCEVMEWNNTLPDAMKACVHHVFAARAEEKPNAEAVCAWDGNFTYSELNGLSIRLAARLQSLGVGPEVKVGLCFEKSKWNIVAMLAVLKAGGAYTQLNPSNPSAMMRGILDDLEVSTILCSPQNSALLANTVPNIIVLDEDAIDDLPSSLEPLRSDSRPDNTAFVVYTSGSTGKAKGIIVEHQGFCSMAQYQTPRLGIDRNSRVLQFAASWFDISNAEVFLTLMRGGCVCISSEEERLSNLAGAINKYQVNWATMVPTAAAILQPDEVPNLKHLGLGGEPIRPDLHARWSRRVVLMNSYGPAECSVITTLGYLVPEVSAQNIGLGLGCRTWITNKDDHNCLVSIGCIGELCVEGPIVTRGYHNNDAMTAAAYITNPGFATQLGLRNMRMYKTGDLVRYESDGSLLLVGRRDTQVKIHGRRIECGEVEHNIVANGFPAGCVVVERIYEGGDEAKPVLAAFIKLRSGGQGIQEPLQLAIEPSTEDKRQLLNLRHTLGTLVQPYMVPTLFIALQDVPLTQTGKKDRKRLRQLGAQLSHSQLEQYRLIDDILEGDDTVVCCTASEIQMQMLWEEVLGLAPGSVRAHDSFLQKGGDSICAIALTSAARRAGKTLTVTDVFRCPRLREMSKCLEDATVVDQDVAPFALIDEATTMIDYATQEYNVPRNIIQDIYPSTPPQEGLMAISTRMPNEYSAIRVLNIPEAIDIDSFKQSWETAVEMFPILRTRIILGPKMESLQEEMATSQSWNERNDMRCIESTVQGVFAEQVLIRPQSLAVAGWDGEMTYQELDELSTRIAQTLVAKGVMSEDIVPVCFEKSKWAVVAMLGILKAGGAVAQLGISHPPSRKQEILEDTNAKLIVVSRQQQASFEGAIDIVVVDEQLIHDPIQETAHLPQVGPSNAAYVLFTSGSTGRSKGIVVEHKGLCTSSSHLGPQMGINAGTRVFQFAAYTFDVSCTGIFTSLQRGATICIPSEEERIDDLAGAITKYRADWLFLTPTVAEMVSPDSVPTLRTLVLGGEAPTEDNIKTWSENLRLILTWGPAETAIYASSTPRVTMETSPTELGDTMGCRLWLCEPDNHDKLTPVGRVGEILVEGALASRGYLNNASQTAAAYIQDPCWPTRNSGEDKPRRMYKTGDLARWSSDGVLRYVSRKDNQTKLHGQRLELGDIEYRISRHDCVRHAVARIPRSGPLKDKLVATLSYRNNLVSRHADASAHDGGATTPIPLSILDLEAIEADLSNIRQDLEDTLPRYQCPTVWINVEAIPLNMNGKINRKAVNDWLEGMDQQLFEYLIQGSSEDEFDAIPSTGEEQVLKTLAGRVLNIQNPSLKRSFLSLGGDSITAMQLRSKARTEGINLTVQDILKSKSLSALATIVKSNSTAMANRNGEEVGASFNLAPIQNFFFNVAKSTKHFNQSFLVKINSTVFANQLERAIEIIVSRHSMLRARFHASDDGTWRQSITDDTRGSFNFRVDEVDSRSQVGQILSQRGDLSMDIGNGPLFAVHLFQVTQNREQLLFFSAHHLVIDMVSWRIILNDLQELLGAGSLSSQSPLSFQRWLHLQEDHIRSLDADAISSAKVADFGYWGMASQPNTFGDSTTNDLTLSETLTTKVFGSSNFALNTEPVEIILAAVIHSFHSIFADRDVPPVFIESHGRETWSDDVDPNETVGWFTTMSPLHVTLAPSGIVEAVRATKDLRRKSGNRVPYLSSLFATRKDGHQQPRDDPRVELLFNYLGKYQQLESKDALFSQVDIEGDAVSATQFDPELRRFALIDITVAVTQGQARISFTHDKKMRHQDKIWQWTSLFQDTLSRAAETLDSMSQQHTVSDFPLLPNLDELQLVSLEENIAAGGIPMDNVQDIFPCIPLQQHMITAQEEHPRRGLYEVNIYQQILAGQSAPFRGAVNVLSLQEAWQKVIGHHAILRTVFIPSSSRPGLHDQVVLISYSPDIPVITCSDENDLLRRIKNYNSFDYHEQTAELRPHHRFTLFSTANGQTTACKLEISHALIDGMSTSILFKDLSRAYRGQLPTKLGSGPYFGDYVAWLTRQHTRTSVEYWRKLISTSKHSFVASPRHQPPPARPVRQEQRFLNINLDPTLVAVIPSFCQLHGVTIATFFQTVWGLILSQCIARTDDTPLFGYMTANRDAAVYGAEDMVGPMTTMLLCRTRFKPTTRVGDLLRRTQGEVLEAMQHQFGLAEAVRELELEDARGVEEDRRRLDFCSSVMSLQYVNAGSSVSLQNNNNNGGKATAAAGLPRTRVATATGGGVLQVNNARRNSNMAAGRSAGAAKEQQQQHRHAADSRAAADNKHVTFRMLGYHDPNEYDMSVGVQVMRGSIRNENDLKIHVGFAYWVDAMPEAKARSIARAFQRCAEELIENGSSGLCIWMLMRRVG